ncbi:hypothetical protein Daus18300_003929 [Diaporthe australafricana]|uniref:Major facilitator superfamily (MFS) profile domain-containing protein n=1 Tax=Diaporthe australafricana TaxID=127596 RepID=A0ABR3XC99_9PEZI
MEGYLEYHKTVSLEAPVDSSPPPESENETRLTSSIAAAQPAPYQPEPYQPEPYQAGQQPDQQQRQDLFRLPDWRKRCIFGCSCLLQFLLQFDMGAVALTLPKIAEDLNPPQVEVFAVATGYLLAQTVFQLVFSHVSQAAGRKFMYLSALLLYLAGAVAAATGPTMHGLVGARVMQGIGAAGMFTMSAIIFVDMTLPRRRAGWQALSQSCGAAGNIFGPLAAGLLFKRFSWHSIFVIEAAIGVFLLAAVSMLLPGDSRCWRARLRELGYCDWGGMLVFFICSVTFLVPINIGGNTAATEWTSPPVISCFVIAGISLGFLIYHQLKLASRPAFPKEIFKRWLTIIAYFGNAVCGMLLSMVFYNLVLFWEGVRGLSTLETGKRLLSATLAYPAAYALTGLAIRKWGKIKWATMVGALLSTLSLGLMQLTTADRPKATLIGISLLAGAACGMFAPAMLNTVIATTESRWHAHAIATRTLLYTAGQCAGISIGVAIFTNAFRGRLLDIHHADEATQNAIEAFKTSGGLLSKIKELKRLSPDGELVRVVVFALQMVWYFALVLALITGIVASVPKCPSLPRDSETEIDTDVERQDGSPEMLTQH